MPTMFGGTYSSANAGGCEDYENGDSAFSSEDEWPGKQSQANHTPGVSFDLHKITFLFSTLRGDPPVSLILSSGS
jgi:hypothetical protein